MEKYYKKPVSLFTCGRGKRTLKLQTLPIFNLCIMSHRKNEEETLPINIIQVVAPPTPLKKSKCKNSMELKKSFLRLGILIKIILLKNLMDLRFHKFWKFPKKILEINAQCNITWVSLSFRKFHALYCNSKRRRKFIKSCNFV